MRTRYRLLLVELNKHLPASHADADNVRHALTKVEEAARHINESIRRRENKEAMAKLEKQFSGLPTPTALSDHGVRVRWCL